MQIIPSFSYEHVSLLINLIVQTYHYDATSVCILWNDDFPFNLQQPNVGNYAAVASLYKTAFIEDVEIPASRLDLLTKFDHKLVESINHTHCESFIAFEKEITMFVNSFMKSVLHSKWRSLKNKFLFIYTKDQVNVAEWNDVFFKDLNNILLVEMINETLFNLKTTKFVGSRNNQPEELILLDRYHGKTKTFEFNQSLYPDKLKDLEGREVIAAAFAYEPFTVLKKNVTDTNVMDVAHGNKDPSKRLLYDGTDAQALFHLCGLYNCTVQVDSSEEKEWGYVYDNLSSNGALGLVFERKADITLMAMYMWYDVYLYLDMSGSMSRSGVLCLVPAPRRVASWLLPLKPFHWLLWLGIAGCLCFEAIGLLVTRWADRTENVSWTESAYFGYVTSLKLFVSQGCNCLPSSFSVRIVLFSCYMIDIIITSVYSGGLASILTIPTLEEVADSFERLARHNQIWVGTVPNWVFSINGSEDPLTRQVINNFRVYSPAQIKQNKKFAKTLGYAIESIDFGYYALPKYLDQDLISSLKIMVDDIYNLYCVAFVPRSWPLLDKFNNMLLMMQSSGLTKYLQWKVVANNMNMNLQRQVQASLKTNFDQFGPIKLDIANFAGMLSVLIMGISLSILAFIGEIMYYRFSRERGKLVLPIDIRPNQKIKLQN